MRRSLRFGSILTLTLALAACTVTVDGPTPPVELAASFNAQGLTNDPSERARVSVPPGESRWVEVRVGSAAAGQDLVYLEAVGGSSTAIRLEMYSVTNITTSLLASRSPDVFAEEAGALPFAAVQEDVGVSPSVVVDWSCLGACVAWAPSGASERYYARITNRTGSTQSVRLYAYAQEFGDRNEPNNTAATATVFTANTVGDGPTGALETVGDRDFFRFQAGPSWPFANLELTLFSEFDGDVVMLIGPDCSPLGAIYGPGESVTVSSGTLVCVRTLDGTAGSSGASFYAIVAE